MELTDYQRDILIRTALGEAAGEGKDGMAAVLHVILNRANSGQFPSDPAEVALQNKQFSTWNKGEGGNNPQKWSENSKSYRTAAAALDGVLNAKSDPTGGALYYHAKSITPYWADDVNRYGVKKVGNHVFYPSHPVPPKDIPNPPTPLAKPNLMVAADWRGYQPLPAPRLLGQPAPSGVGTPNLATRKVNTVPIDPVTGNPVVAKASLPAPPRLSPVGYGADWNNLQGMLAGAWSDGVPSTPSPPKVALTRDNMWFTSNPPLGPKPTALPQPVPVKASFGAQPAPRVSPVRDPLLDAQDEKAFLRSRQKLSVPTGPAPRMPMNPTAAMMAARQPRVVQAPPPMPRPRPVMVQQPRQVQQQAQPQQRSNGGLLGMLLEAFGGGSGGQSGGLASILSGGVQKTNPNITYADPGIVNPGSGREINGIDIAFMPKAVQQSSRWNTGY